MALSYDITANTAAAVKSTKDVSKALKDVGNDVDDVSKKELGGLEKDLKSLGNIAGGAGIAAAATAVIGAMVSEMEAAQQKLNEVRDAAAGLASELYENNGELPIKGRIDELFQVLAKESTANGPIQRLIDSFTDFGTVIDDVRDTSKSAKLPVQQFLDALKPGNLELTSTTLKTVSDRIKDMRAARGGWVPVWDEEYQSLKSVETELKTVQDQMLLARDLNSTVGSSLDSEAYKAKIDAIAEGWRNATTDASTYFKAGQEGVRHDAFAWESYLADAERNIAAADEFKRRIVTLPPEIQAEGQRVMAESGSVGALAFVTSYESASAADRGRFESVARANGDAAGTSFGTAVASETERAAQAKAQGWGTLKMPVKAVLDTSAVDWYRPPVVTIQTRLQAPTGVMGWQ